jgi:hypothetical protein
MAKITTKSLRNPSEVECATLPVKISGRGFHIVAHSHKIYSPSGVPVFLFDVESESGERIGIASAILEPDLSLVQSFGHVCVTLLEKHATVGRLAEVASSLLGYVFRSGLREALIVVPSSHQLSVDACRLLKPISETPTESEDCMPSIAFLYKSH